MVKKQEINNTESKEDKGLIEVKTAIAEREANDIVSDLDFDTIPTVDFNVKLNMTLLKTSVDAICEKSGAKVKILVNSKPEESDPMTLDDVNEILKQYNVQLNVADLSPILSIFGINATDLSLELSKIFFYSEFGENDFKENTSDTEFAFKITIHNEPAADKKLGFFTVNSLSFAIWKTDRKNILKSMELMSVNELLNGIS